MALDGNVAVEEDSATAGLVAPVFLQEGVPALHGVTISVANGAGVVGVHRNKAADRGRDH